MSTDLDALFSPKSKLFDVPAADPSAATAFFLSKLHFECDPSDVWHDLQQGITGFTVLDVRSREAYAERHAAGAVSLPHWEITPESADGLGLDRDTLYVTYCWGPHCNGATKGAAKLAALGYRVKEMIGGLPGWEAEGQPVEGTSV
ncbi:rhodanese-like domain-containing protein [Actinacidiphila acididurans]|uniref:Rhodanese-like domain-containing protein n=1 Tax=Actinacidiphila acididurans TaxID=2784346 RepID=A0ABS2TL93_9ACTN|nr:rhodanese-like domain-containing protein [Actinacidiphila acididurans]MBM9504109.1 rhodanese-like domain-containing protein [Actinacidiphila acididurans]